MANDLRAYGATGDGIADDTIALQRAINYSEYLTITNGIYRITDQIIIKNTISIYGFCAKLVFDLPKNYSKTNVVDIVGHNVDIMNLDFEIPKDSCSYAILFSGCGSAIYRCNFKFIDREIIDIIKNELEEYCEERGGLAYL